MRLCLSFLHFFFFRALIPPPFRAAFQPWGRGVSVKGACCCCCYCRRCLLDCYCCCLRHCCLSGCRCALHYLLLKRNVRN